VRGIDSYACRFYGYSCSKTNISYDVNWERSWQVSWTSGRFCAYATKSTANQITATHSIWHLTPVRLSISLSYPSILQVSTSSSHLPKTPGAFKLSIPSPARNITRNTYIYIYIYIYTVPLFRLSDLITVIFASLYGGMWAMLGLSTNCRKPLLRKQQTCVLFGEVPSSNFCRTSAVSTDIFTGFP
jgi:hypothetical protein